MKDSSMPHEPQRRERQITLWESDGRIVPLKPVAQTGGSKRGNSRAGKAAKLTRDSVRPSTAHSGRPSVLARLTRITYRAEREPTLLFNNLYTLLNIELLRQAFWQLRRGKAPGVKPPRPCNATSPPKLSPSAQLATRHTERQWQDATTGYSVRGR